MILEYVGTVDRLDKDSSAELARRMDAGEDGARLELIVRSIPLAAYFARRQTRGRPHLYDDAESNALLALVETVDRWDPDACPLSMALGRCYYRITMLTRYSDRLPIELPPYLLLKPRDLWKDDDTTAAAERALRAGREFIEDTGGLEYRDHGFDGIDEADESAWTAAEVSRLLGLLTPDQRDIVSRYYGLEGRDPETATAIGRERGITRQGVLHHIDRARLSMRRHAEAALRADADRPSAWHRYARLASR